ncbi:MAG: GNAT family N-acetyltransferase [Polyangiaceae bacterium]
MQVELGPNGRFGYPHLEAYFADSSDRFAFLIHHEGHIAGFALVKRGSPFSDDLRVLDVAEFFVLRRFRSRGVGREAAQLLWRRLPGAWSVRAADKNPRAVAFWREAIAVYGQGAASESQRTTATGSWTVFSFDSEPAP